MPSDTNDVDGQVPPETSGWFCQSPPSEYDPLNGSFRYAPAAVVVLEVVVLDVVVLELVVVLDVDVLEVVLLVVLVLDVVLELLDVWHFQVGQQFRE